jgi:ferredoxin
VRSLTGLRTRAVKARRHDDAGDGNDVAMPGKGAYSLHGMPRDGAGSMPIGYAVEPERCLGCGSCAILAPGVFAVVRRVRLVRQPATAAEVTACAAAALVCPTQAIAAVIEAVIEAVPRG